MKKINLLQMAILFIPGVMGSVQAETLFECKLPDNKSATIAMQGAQLYYTFGKQNSEPDMQLNRDNDWYFYGQHGSGSNYQLSFRVVKGDYNYVIYSQDTGNGVTEGLVAYKGNKVLYNKHCTEPAKYDASLFQTDAADIGMNDESDQVSDYITSIANNGNNQRNDNSTQQSNQDREQTQTNQNPIEVRLAENTAWGTMSMVNITSLTNSVTINDVVVNRGNCTLFVSNQLKQYRQRTLKYGEQTKYGFNTDCNIREIVVKTNQGDWVFNN
ncbi:hypothetical protein DO628_04280 [Salmonella enterica subsp. salamae]|uniref:Uncharacterized protein n=3 Tax=Salmonella enterica TaxID=28901 RepID=A0A8F7YEF8_SALER|nr:hypothetical protein [Salmonella enterica]EAA4081177.1 hypothetical protein [Salmonella enterica subsp. salamae serovar Sofia]EBK2698975.1 hypothetical protein [Salmonella enterica subsp. enterica serovar Paratyphi B]EDV4531060.1 hypothetical protein [Salmonella enterica subsp. enterica]EAZ1915985.1 hypothetical protein [Salmonella enterica]EBA5232597.1 hypothetical protein [Salmonella enterica]